MSSPKFDPLDLELLDRVYDLACLYVEVDNLCRPADEGSAAVKDALRKQIFVVAGSGPVRFDPLCDQVLARVAPMLARQGSAA